MKPALSIETRALVYFVIGAEFSLRLFTPEVLLCVCVSVYHKGSTALAGCNPVGNRETCYALLYGSAENTALPKGPQ